MLAASLSREGEPVAVIFGPAVTPDGGALDIQAGRLSVGVLMIRLGVEQDALDFVELDTGELIRLQLPKEARGLTADAYAQNLELEVIPV